MPVRKFRSIEEMKAHKTWPVTYLFRLFQPKCLDGSKRAGEPLPIWISECRCVCQDARVRMTDKPPTRAYINGARSRSWLRVWISDSLE